MKTADNAHIVMSFNLGDNFEQRLFMVATVTDPKTINLDAFLRTIKAPTVFDILSIEVVQTFPTQTPYLNGGMATPLMPTPYGFGMLQISQCILMDPEMPLQWQGYHKHLNSVIKGCGDIENVTWFFQKEALGAYLSSLNARYHQTQHGNNEIICPAWFEIVSCAQYNQPGEGYSPVYSGPRHGNSNPQNNGW